MAVSLVIRLLSNMYLVSFRLNHLKIIKLSLFKFDFTYDRCIIPVTQYLVPQS